MAGKRIVNAYKTIDKTQAYALKEAVKIVKSNATAKFDETIDVAINLGVDPKHADQMIRGVCALPHGTGKTVRVAVLAQGEKADEAISSVPRIWLIPSCQAKLTSTDVSPRRT